MSNLTSDQVRHIAKLARLRLSEEEVKKFTPELSSIFGYIDMLSEVDTKGVEATAQVTGQENVFRADEIRTQATAPDALLAASPLPITDHQIVSPSAHG